MTATKQEKSSQQESQPRDSADQHLTAAIQKVPEMLLVLLGIANDSSGASGPRVAAARAVCEMSGVLGKPRERVEDLTDRNLEGMSVEELEQFISEGRQALQSFSAPD